MNEKEKEMKERTQMIHNYVLWRCVGNAHA